jgi:hypothetical protein
VRKVFFAILSILKMGLLKVFRPCFGVSCLLSLFSGFASGETLPQGYIYDVEAERNESYVEIYLFQQSTPVERSISDLIWNPELSAEFRKKYYERFGAVDTGAIRYLPGTNSIVKENRGLINGNDADEQNIQERRRFAEFMTKRVTEWHVDHYIKEEPSMRPVYEAKETLSKMEVQVNKEIKLNMAYSFAGNVFDLIVENPYVDSKVSVEMDPRAFGPGRAEESRFVIGRNLTKEIRFNTYLKSEDGIVSGELVKTWPSRWVTSLGSSTWTRNGGISTRETRTYIGGGISF